MGGNMEEDEASKILSNIDKEPSSIINNRPSKKQKFPSGNEANPINLLDSSDSTTAIIKMEEEEENDYQHPAIMLELPATQIGSATVFSKGKAQFPHTIDTGFAGHHKYQNLKFKKIDVLKTEAKDVNDLPYYWPNETPVPFSSGGGFREILGINKRTVRKSHSRVARLAGIITTNVRIKNETILRVCCGNTHYDDYIESRNMNLSRNTIATAATTTTSNGRKYVFADDLWQAIQNCGENLDTLLSRDHQQILRVIAYFNDTIYEPSLFRERCLFVLAEAPQLQPSSKLPVVAELKFYVYFRRSLFGLAANAYIKILLDTIQPLPDQRAWTLCRQRPRPTGVYRHSPKPLSHGFSHSLPGVLWENESTGYDVGSTAAALKKYKGVNVTLRDYQLESVAWMRNQENRNVEETGGGVAGLNGYFWQKREFADGRGEYYYFPLGGQILMHPPPTVTGGLLAEEMGLGKTVIALELICSDANDVPAKMGGTLVVLPVSLLAQWEEEISSKAPHLRKYIYHGEGATRQGIAADEFCSYDIVLTTMSKLKELTANLRAGQTRNKALTKVVWHRLLIDEAQYLKNDTNAIAKSANEITAKNVWMLSGTPLTNKLDDLRGELSLLRVWPFTLGSSTDQSWQNVFWNECIKENWDSRNGESLPIIHNLMDAVSMRHSREQLRIDGSPLVELPLRDEKFIAITMDSKSSEAYVYRWLEAVTLALLHGLNRFDFEVCSLITKKLRQIVSCPSLLLDQPFLKQIDKILSVVANLANASAERCHHRIRRITLVEALKERRDDTDKFVLTELLEMMSCPPICNHCRGSNRSNPAYLSCNHLYCIQCCRELLSKGQNFFECPNCRKKTLPNDITEVILPPELLPSDNSRAKPPSDSKFVHEIDIDEATITNAIKSIQSNPTFASSTTPAAETSTSQSDQREYNVSHQVDFQRTIGVHKPPTFDSLKNHPKPHPSATPDAESTSFLGTLQNRNDMLLPVRHAATCEGQLSTNPKIKALCELIQKVRTEDIEAKICIFSEYPSVLNEISEAINNVSYTVEYAMTQQNNSVPPAVVENVPSSLIRRRGGRKVSFNGDDDRYMVGDKDLESKRPAVSSYELLVGYSVTILSEEGASTAKKGKVVAVNHDANGKVVSYDVKVLLGELLRGVRPTSLRDNGVSTWAPAKILKVFTRRLMDAKYTSTEATENPFEHALGYVRIDGKVRSSDRGQIVEAFKSNPMTSVCLLTKISSGVGLNLTMANHVIIFEPSMDAAEEIQCIARCHRIGQTRRVSVYKFYLTLSVEERILMRRQQRGELRVSINSISGSAASAEEEDTKKSNIDSEMSSSKALAFEDLKLLLGDTTSKDCVVDLASTQNDSQNQASSPPRDSMIKESGSTEIDLSGIAQVTP